MKVLTRFGALAALLFLTVGCARDRRDGPNEWTVQLAPPAAVTEARTITVSAVGSASGTPDSVTLSLGVEGIAATTVAALDLVSTAATDLTDYLLGAGVEAKNLQTTGLSIYPIYDYTDGGKQGAITGYQASISVTAVIDGIDLAATVIDGAAAAVGDSLRINGLSLAITDRAAVLAEARANAIEQARTQAEQLAEAADVTLGAVVSINETASDVSYPTSPGVSDGGDVPISPGTQVLQVSVTMVFAITN